MLEYLSPAIQIVFEIIVQLVALGALTLSCYHGRVYFNAVREHGWGFCGQGFVRYARDTFWQSLAIFSIFLSWSWQMMAGQLPPIISQPWGSTTAVAVTLLYLASLDIVRYTLSEYPFARFLFGTATFLVLIANGLRYA